MGSVQAVVDHYSSGTLRERVFAALRGAGKDPDNLSAADLVPLDQLHTGGVAAIEELVHDAGIGAGTRVADFGSGLCGPARIFAGKHGAVVHAVDVTPEFVDLATELNERCGLSSAITVTQASAADSGLAAGAFDAVTLIHVGMNIADKARVFAEASRVLHPQGVFAIYDIMARDGDTAEYPMPWASSAGDSFVRSVAQYDAALAGAGFAVDSTRDRSPEALAFLDQPPARSAEGEPLGPEVVMGPNMETRLANLRRAIEAGVLAPTVIVARRAGRQPDGKPAGAR
jgi:SAM-dependent methyltransferase